MGNCVTLEDYVEIKGSFEYREIKNVSTLECYFYLLFKNTFHDFL